MPFLFWKKRKPSQPPNASPEAVQTATGATADAPSSPAPADAEPGGTSASSDTAAPSSASAQATPGAAPASPEIAADDASSSEPPASVAVPTRPTTLGTMREHMLKRASAAAPATDALNGKIVQAVQLSNAENVGYAPSQIAIGPDMMISQASGLVAQSAAAYFDGVSKLALASQSVLLKKMTEELVAGNLEKAAEDALGALATDVMMAAAAAVAAAAGAIEAESASFAIDKIDQSIAKYSSTLASHRRVT